jgi:hypothetical protein
VNLLTKPDVSNSQSQLVEELGAERAVAAALAVITGHTKPLRQRSLLSNSDGYITVQFHSRQAIFSPTFVFNELRTAFALDETVHCYRAMDVPRHSFTFICQVIESVRSMTITADNKGAVFDVSGEFKAQVQALMDRPAVSGYFSSFACISLLIRLLQEHAELPHYHSTAERSLLGSYAFVTKRQRWPRR